MISPFTLATSVDLKQIICFVLLWAWLRPALKGLSIFKYAAFLGLPSVLAYFGGKLGYHLVVDHQIQLAGVGGMYYAAWAAQLLGMYLLCKTLVSKERADLILKQFLLASPWLYAVLRVACFYDGCCYGTLTSLPWAVVYHDESALTPLIGLPLHPVQLYAAAHGVILGLFLLFRSSMPLIDFFTFYLMLFGWGRFFTDSFRADAHRQAILGLGINLWISLILGSVGTVLYLSRKKRFHVSKNQTCLSVLMLITILLFTGCQILPTPPNKSVVAHTATLMPQWIYEHDMAKQETHRMPRALIFAIAENIIQPGVREEVSALYNAYPPPRLEEIVWWNFAPKMALVYDKVFRIPYFNLTVHSLKYTLQTVEKLGLPYDLVLITHGYPNHLLLSKGRKMISWKDLQSLKGQLKNLEWVYLEACFGESLANDWLETGAKYVIAFPGFTTNYFFFDRLLDQWSQDKGSIASAYEKARSTFPEHFRKNFVYKELVSRFFNMSPDEYLEDLNYPEIKYRP